MNNFKINPKAIDELRHIFSPAIVDALELKLKEKDETLVDYAQIHGDHLHYPILIKGQTYFYGIWTNDKQGNTGYLTRVCDYIGIGGK